MNEDISIRYQWTAEEILTGYRWHFRHRVRPILRWAYFILSPLLMIVGAFQLQEADSSFRGGILLAVGIYVPVMFLVIRPWLVRRQFAKRPDRNTECEWRFSGESIHARSAHSTSDFTWPALAKVVQTPVGFLLYPTEQIFHWLPRHGFASEKDFDSLSQIAQKHAAAFHRTA